VSYNKYGERVAVFITIYSTISNCGLNGMPIDQDLAVPIGNDRETSRKIHAMTIVGVIELENFDGYTDLYGARSIFRKPTSPTWT